MHGKLSWISQIETKRYPNKSLMQTTPNSLKLNFMNIMQCSQIRRSWNHKNEYVSRYTYRSQKYRLQKEKSISMIFDNRNRANLICNFKEILRKFPTFEHSELPSPNFSVLKKTIGQKISNDHSKGKNYLKKLWIETVFIKQQQ